MRILLCAALVAVGGLAAVPVHCQFSKPEDAIRYRQSGYVIMGTQMGRIFSELRRKAGRCRHPAECQHRRFVSQFARGGLRPGSKRAATRRRVPS